VCNVADDGSTTSLSMVLDFLGDEGSRSGTNYKWIRKLNSPAEVA
jgi:hypothetical protein